MKRLAALTLVLAGCGTGRPVPAGVFHLPAAGDGLGPEGARHVDVAIDGRGRLLAGWQVDGDSPAVMVADDRGSMALTALGHPRAPFTASGVRVAADASGGAAVVWSQQGPAETGEILAATRTPDGAFGEPAVVSFPPTAYQPQVVAQPGGWLLLWDQWYGGGYGVAVATGAAGAWALPASSSDVLSPLVFFSNAPRVATSAGGAALVAWYQSVGGPLMVWGSERASSSAPFSRPGTGDFLSAPGAPVDSHPIANPAPALAADGRAAVVWTQENGEGSVLLYMARRDAAGTWHRPRDLSDAFGPAQGKASCAQVVFDDGGDLRVVWYQDLGGGDAVLAAQVPANAFLDPAPAPIRLSAEGSLGLTPALAAIPGGGALVAYVERSAGRNRIVARLAPHGGSFGTPWALSPDAGDAVDPAVAAGPGVTAVAWTQGPLGRERVFVARGGSMAP